ncbi:MAG: family 43 glycosylhydrolase, partial [Bacteroidaceae bacterium]|nr:family 43 glycosylhydrolase [Bacteroidaceae bacterium]
IYPALLLDPTTGRLWMTYGTYFGAIRIVELDPKTAKRLPKSEPIDVAIDCEATALMYHNGWYYLLGTHGTCCDGVNSTYNIVCGRSREVTGPYVDNVGRDMLEGGGKMVLSAGNRVTGPGHFGRYIEEEGCEKMSCHFEADFDRSGKSVLGIRALLWKNDWPVAADPFKEGTFEIESERRGYALELGVDFVRMQGAGRGFGNASTPDVPLKEQLLSDVIGDWPKGNIEVRLGDYMFRPHQKWTITAVGDKGGYLGQPYYKITIEGTNRALAATADGELTSVPQYSGAPEQLWRIEQLIDGTYRIINEKVPGKEGEQFALVCTGDCSLTLGKYDFNDVNCKWNLRDR